MDLLKLSGAKQQFHALLLGLLVLVVIAYVFSFSKTFDAYALAKQNSKALTEVSSAPAQIQRLQEQLAQLEEGLIQSDYDRKLLFETVNVFCEAHQLKLNHFHPEQRFIHNEYKIITNQLEVEGSYTDIVELMYYLEQEQRLGHIASSDFQKKEERRTKRKYLTADVYIQNIQPANLSSND